MLLVIAKQNAIGSNVSSCTTRSNFYKRSPSFPLVFALALTLLYWGRPAGYGFNYLELMVAIVVWSGLRAWEKPVFLVVVAAVMASRWWAFLETLRGENMSQLTPQTPICPWETWLVLPLAWLLLVRAMALPSGPVERVGVEQQGRRV